VRKRGRIRWEFSSVDPAFDVSGGDGPGDPGMQLVAPLINGALGG